MSVFGNRQRATALRIVPAFLLLLCASGRADESPEVGDPEQFFESKIRPILVEKCQECHGADKNSGELRLDTLQGMLDGGESGPAIVPGNPDESLLVGAVNYDSLEMPPTGKLSADKIALLTQWIKLGAPWPNAGPIRAATKPREVEITDQDRQFWSFRPPVRVPVPTFSSVARAENPIDAFLLHALSEKGLSPSAPAAPRELIRRLTFDLTGLPPSPEDVDAFTNDARPDAYSRSVDRLLASPQFGERWGRHWLDVVRFAQTNGYERDAEKLFAWRYRDYVIDSFNKDKPYNQFIKEQVAGDEMDPASDESIIATGFLRLGVWDDEPDDLLVAEFDELDDLLSTTGTAVLGLTIGCARCHDHKFDPIPQSDYYSLLSFFRNVRGYEKREGVKQEFAKGIRLSTGEDSLAVREGGAAAPPTHVLKRGDVHSPAEEVSPGFLQVLCASKELAKASLPTPPPESKTSGRRSALAEWLTARENPLTGRVIVNRLWHHHFGQGIVPTPSDFGKTGTEPSNLNLLDWLARELADDDWRLKQMHRLMVESAAYRQSSHISENPAAEVDPSNRLVWRQSLRRLDAEVMRDAVLAVNGQLNLEMGGRGFFPELSREVLASQSIPGNGWGDSLPSQEARRSVYTFIKRTLRAPILETMDAASPDQPIASRAVTTIAPHALLWLNSSFMSEESRAAADRLEREAPASLDQQIDRLYELALQRKPTEQEVAQAKAFVERQEKGWRELEMVVPERDPLEGWNLVGGSWSVRDDGGLEVTAQPEAKILSKEGTVTDGIVEAEVMLVEAKGDAGVLCRVERADAGVDALVGYYVCLSAGRIRLGKQMDNYTELAGADVKTEPAVWNRVRIELAGPRIRVWLADAVDPILEFTDPAPIPAGKVGARSFQAHAAIRNLLVTTPQGSLVAGKLPTLTEVDHQTAAHRQALAGLCALIFNINEFVYVD